MPTNIKIYPLDFADAIKGSTSKGTSLEAAVNSIAVQSRDAAQRLAATRRISGQNEIFNLQQNTKVNFRLLPLNKVGKASRVLTNFLGTVGYMSGGSAARIPNRTAFMHRVSFINEAIDLTGLKISTQRCYLATITNFESGKFCGGSQSLLGILSDSIDKLHFSKQTTSKSNTNLSRKLRVLTGGMGTNVTGIIAGGGEQSEIATKVTHFYNHAADTISYDDNFLTTPKYTPHNGLTSQFSGFIWAGYDGSWSLPNRTLFRTIDEIPYTTGTWSINALSTTVPHIHHIHAALSNPINGYVAGGSNSTPPWSSWFTNDITRFTFSGQTATIIGAKLSVPLLCMDATGSSAAGFIIGGEVSEPWSGRTLSDKLRYDTETTSMIGAVLTNPTADEGTVADYSPGWSES